MKTLSKLQNVKNMRFLISILTVMLAVALCSSLLVAQAPDRSKPPELGPTPSLKLPPIQHLKLSNGVQIVLMEKHEVPLMQIDLIVRTGSIMNPADKIGLASMTSSMIEISSSSRGAPASPSTQQAP